MFISFWEIFDMLLMIGVVGFIFMSMPSFKPKKDVDVLDKYLKKSGRFDWSAFWFAALVTAPAIIFHEFGHKFTALAYGHEATFHAAYLWLLIAIVLKFLNFPFIFFVPAYVSISSAASVSESTLIAFMGPAVNLLLFLIAFIVLKVYTNKKMSNKTFQFWTLTRNINLFLLIFNLLPIPGFDGFKIFSGLWQIAGF